MPDPPQGGHLTCSLCSQLREREDAVEHDLGDEEDTHLPAAAEKLETVRDIRPGHPGLRLQRCPECGTYYLYRSIYEYLVGFGGSYDEYILWRLTDNVGADYLHGRRSEPLPGME